MLIEVLTLSWERIAAKDLFLTTYFYSACIFQKVPKFDFALSIEIVLASDQFWGKIMVILASGSCVNKYIFFEIQRLHFCRLIEFLSTWRISHWVLKIDFRSVVYKISCTSFGHPVFYTLKSKMLQTSCSLFFLASLSDQVAKPNVFSHHPKRSCGFR